MYSIECMRDFLQYSHHVNEKLWYTYSSRLRTRKTDCCREEEEEEEEIDFFSHPTVAMTVASTGCQATPCTLSEWCVSVAEHCCVVTSHTCQRMAPPRQPSPPPPPRQHQQHQGQLLFMSSWIEIRSGKTGCGGMKAVFKTIVRGWAAQ